VLREDFWGDLANTFLLRPVYRETKKEHAAKVSTSQAGTEQETAKTEEALTASEILAKATAVAETAAIAAALGPRATSDSFAASAATVRINGIADAVRTLGHNSAAAVAPVNEVVQSVKETGRHALVFPEVVTELVVRPFGVRPTSEAVLKDWGMRTAVFRVGGDPGSTDGTTKSVVEGLKSADASAGVSGVPRSAETEEAVDFFRGLYDAEPDEHAWNLGGSLLTHAVALAADGRPDDAVKAAEEAIALFRSKQVSGEGFASALNTYADMLTTVGRANEAAELAKEATQVYEELYEKYPKTYEPGLVAARISLSERQATAGDHHLAVISAADAVERSRKMEARIPGGHTADLALALANFAQRMTEIGNTQEATEALTEVIDLYDRLATQYPVTYGPRLETSRNLLTRWKQATASANADTDEGPYPAL
jgi:tetratricopeptide (TPR) repeat protein